MARTRFDRDYYRIMGLAPEATEDEIRRAYRRLALEWHPDRRGGDPRAAERFKEISEAYAVLISPAKRGEYDAARRLGATADWGRTHRREDLLRDLVTDPRASAIFEELAREFERMGLRVDSRSFHQTLFGGRTVVSGHVVIVTPFSLAPALFRLARAALRGARAATAPAEPQPLPRAPGVLGALGRAVRWFLGLPPAPARPAEALGAGDLLLPLQVTRDEARRGARRRVALAAADEVLVTVPAGVRAGTRLRLRGRGHARPDGSRGDAYLSVEIAD
ncbi:MAG: DnaJ domain-containing protein [Candidatus Rokubacteria bacterium]|nr:DnaJ domain-containing protein [Candidatus Rokubacteria bacterium]